MLTKEEVIKLEEEVDRFIIDEVDESYPRYKYIYHLNLAHIDIILDSKLNGTHLEKYIHLSLNANIHWAYIKLKEEKKIDYKIDENMYKECFINIINGIFYSFLCNEFPKVNSGYGKIIKQKEDKYRFETTYFKREDMEFISDRQHRTSLNAILNKVCENEEDFMDIDFKLSKYYLNYQEQQFRYNDFKDFTLKDWGGVNLFITISAMRRWVKMYEKKFRMEDIKPANAMIVMSQKSIQEISNQIGAKQKDVKKIIKTLTYKPLGKGLYPKANICDTPIILTKDNNLIINPFIDLFHFPDNKYLNYLRRQNKKEYCRLKTDMTERHVPFIVDLLKKKYEDIKVITNVNIKIKNSRKNKREVDLILIDEKTGTCVYFEIKNFYEPVSFCECKSLDKELSKALKKLDDQIRDIEYNWDNLKKVHNINCDINRIEGFILSYNYLGTSVEINEKYKILNNSLFYEALINSSNIEELIKECKDVDTVLTQTIVDKDNITFEFANKVFSIDILTMSEGVEKLIQDINNQRSDSMIKFADKIESTGANKDIQLAINLVLSNN